ncbi:protein of unknown function [Tenacibaculum sp. 190524A02b]
MSDKQYRDSNSKLRIHNRIISSLKIVVFLECKSSKKLERGQKIGLRRFSFWIKT